MKTVKLYDRYIITELGETINAKTGRSLTPTIKYGSNGRLAAVTMTIQTPEGRRVVNYSRFIYEAFNGPLESKKWHVKHKNNDKVDFREANLYAVRIQPNQKQIKLKKMIQRRERLDEKIRKMEEDNA